jgi:hypothetical protein
MTARHTSLHAGSASPRPSARIGKVAELLDCDPSDVRRMLRTGELEGHCKGIRGKRVYLDSVAAYQDARAIVAEIPKNRLRAQRSAVSRASSAASDLALRKAGILR